MTTSNILLRGLLLAGAAVALDPFAIGQLNSGQPQILSTNQMVTPLAPLGSRYFPLNPNLADNPNYTVGEAVTTVTSPDKKTLLILTSGYNLWNYPEGANAGNTNPTDSTEWVFVYDISTAVPIQKQAISVPNTYSGIAFNPNGTEFYVAGGFNDNVHIYDLANGTWSETGTPVALNHNGNPYLPGIALGANGVATYPEAAGLAVSANGKTIVVANYENDSISLLGNNGSGWVKTGEYDLRPGKIDPTQKGVPGGEFPFWVQIKGNDTAYVTSVRDREIDVVSISGSPSLTARVKVTGSPNKSVLNKDQSLLYVAEDNSDTVAVIDTASNKLLGEIKTPAPAHVWPNTAGFRGANPNSVALSNDEKTLYVTNAGENALAVIKLGDKPGTGDVAGLIPTGFYPNSVSLSADGKRLYIVNGKSATGPNPLNCHPLNAAETVDCDSSNQYDLQLTKAGFQIVPVPINQPALDTLTQQVFDNDNFGRTLSAADQAKMLELHRLIHHVIYIIKENRTYDQILGDLPVGDGDPSITQFGQDITPNFHAIASNFVDFDNFYDVSDVSGDGWPWSTSARTTDTIEKEIPPNYAGRGLDNNSEGTNRDLNMGLASQAARVAAFPLLGAVGFTDPDLLPGNGNVAAPDSREGDVGEGYIWDAVLKAGLSVRDYGMFIDIVPYNVPVSEGGTPVIPDPFTAGVKVAISSSPSLAAYTDPYFRGFDNNFPDYYRFTEWNREFKQFQASGKLPNLSLVRLMHDHTGNFSTAISGVNTVELQEADNDYGVGAVVDAVAHSKFKDDTVIFVIEDDAQDGADHVDAHRSTFYLVGPYVKHKFVDSTRYNTVSVLRTIEDILAIAPLNMNDAHAFPMVDAFDVNQKTWTYNVTASAMLAPPNTTLPIPQSQFASLTPLKPLHDAQWWAAQTKGMDFSVEDHLDTPKYNLVMWKGTMGDKPYPTFRSGKDLRLNRAELLKSYRDSQNSSANSSAGASASSTQNPVTAKPGN